MRLSMLAAVLAVSSISLSAQAQESVSLDPAGLRGNNVEFETAEYQGQQALRVSGAPDNQNAYVALPVEGFSDGVITLRLVGDVAPETPPQARGFTGVAFRTADDGFEAIYLRPRNARVENQLFRNRSVQYISEPGYTWDRLREEHPGQYETYVDMEMGVWIDVRIEVEGETARLYVHNAEQPTLIVNDLRRGESEGGIGLWVGPWTVAHFADVTVEHAE